METITSIKCSPHNPDVCSVRVGRKTVARLSSDAVNRLGLREGSAWDATAQRLAHDAESRESALQVAYKLLKRRPLGTSELRDRLYKKGLTTSAIAAAVEEMSRRGLLDDAAYAKLVLQNELARKPAGRRKLADKLYRKRLPREVIGHAVTEVLSRRDPVADARSLVERKANLSSFTRLDPQARKRRLWSLLTRRGFDHETINAALAGICEEGE